MLGGVGCRLEPGAVQRRGGEDAFFFAMAAAFAAIVGIGFAQSYFFAGLIFSPLPNAVVHVHALLMVSWVTLFFVQIGLVATGNVRYHQRLGLALLLCAVLIVCVAVPTVVLAARRAGSGVGSFQTFGDFAMLLVFPTLLLLGYANRGDASSHKRFMLLATATLMAPAAVRWPFAFVQNGPLGALVIFMVVPILLVIWDVTTLHRIHRSTVIGFLLIALLFPADFLISGTPAWHVAMHWIRGH